MILAIAGGFAVGFAVGEYYRRIVDRIRCEQIEDLKQKTKQKTTRLREIPVFDAIDRPEPRRRGFVSEDQHAELMTTGHTAGRYKGGEAV